MPERKFKVIPVTLVAVLLAVLGLAAYALFEVNRPVPRPPLPNPNGFETLLEATRAAQYSEINPRTATSNELRSYLEKNHGAIEAIRKALPQKSQVPLGGPSNFSSQASAMKIAGSLFDAEAIFAELERRTNDAAKSYMDLIRVGETISAGGLAVDKMVGFMTAKPGINGLHSLLSGLTDGDCRELIAKLRIISSQRESFEDVWTRDKVETRSYGRSLDRQWFGIRAIVSEWAAAWQYRGLKQKMEKSFRKADTTLDLVIIELAIRRHSLSHQMLPAHLSDLVPQYLSKCPNDPFSGREFIYRLKINGYQLYSVGPDGKDDGGAPLSKGGNSDLQPGDLSLDSY